MSNDRINKKFDEIDGKIESMMEFCHTLKQENKELIVKIKSLETELDKKTETEGEFFKQDLVIQSKMDGLLKKLNDFSGDTLGEYKSNF